MDKIGSVTVNVMDAQKDDAVWLKISNYPGWIASSSGQQLKIFEAGPGFMLVSPQVHTGEGKVYDIQEERRGQPLWPR
jgi:hypothetical protein